MPGLSVCEASATQVEVGVLFAAFEVRVEAHEAREVHHIYNVEVGESAAACVEPHYAVDYILEQRFVVLFAAGREIGELGHEHGYRQFVGIEGYGAERAGYGGVADAQQAGVLSVVEHYVENRQWLQQLFLYPCACAFRYVLYERQPSVGLCEHVGDDLRVAVFKCA